MQEQHPAVLALGNGEPLHKTGAFYLTNAQKLALKGLAAGQESRRFLAAPQGSTWAEMRIHAKNFDTPK